MEISEIIKMVLPLLIFEILLKVYCLFKLRNDEIKVLSKPLWIAIIVLVSTIGPIAYLVFGREKD